MNILLPNSIAKKLASKIVQANDSLTQQRDHIRYGLEWIISITFQVVLIIALAIPFGVFYEAMAMLIVGSSLRAFSGGAHLGRFFSCLTYSTLQVIVLSVIAKKYIDPLNVYSSVFYLLLGVSFVLIVILAPVLNKKKALFSQSEIRRQKVLSIVAFLIFVGFFSYFFKGTSVMFAVFFAIFIQTFSLTRTAHVLFQITDQAIDSIFERM